jgi:hypothetical protein
MLKTAALVVALAGSAALAGPFIAATVSPNPDTLLAFDSATPGTNTTVHTLAGNFTRGIVMDSPTTGYAVYTSSLSGSDTGFYRFTIGGANTQIAELPFTSGTDGDLTWNADKTLLYWVVDPPTAGVEEQIWSITPSGTFTEISTIALPGVTAPNIIGAAFDRATGDILVFDITSDSLYSVDIPTGMGTLVGPAGVAFSSGVGGMAFDEVTGELVLATNLNSNAVYSVNKTTGAVTLLGLLGTGNGVTALAFVPQGAPTCRPDLNSDGELTFDDIQLFVQLYNANDARADFNNDQEWTFDDIQLFIQLYNAGC